MISLRNVEKSFAYGPARTYVLRRVDLDIAARGKEIANRTQHAPALLEPAAPRREAIGPPPFLHRPALAVADPPPYVSFSRALSSETPP